MTVLLSPFQFGYLSFSCLIAMARTSNTILNISGESWHPCLFPDIRRKAFSSSLWNKLLALGLSYMAFTKYVEVYSFYTHFDKSFYHEWMLNFFRCLFCIYWDDMVFVLHFVNMVYHVDWFVDIEPSLHLWDKSHLIMVYNSPNMLFNLVCLYFVEDFYICIHLGYWPVIFVWCLCLVLASW